MFKNLVNPVKKATRQGFTIVELLVAMSLLVMLLGLSGMVFNTTVAAHRAAGATIDVSRSLRAITEQLNADLRGLRKDAPVFIVFNALDTDGDGVLEHYDAIHFFADGDFQTTRQYGYDNTGDGAADGIKTIYGNMARIYYGHANSIDLVANPTATSDFDAYNILSRKSHILTADSDIYSFYGEIPLVTDTGGLIDYTEFANTFGLTPAPLASLQASDENELEFNTISLTHWMNALNYLNSGNPDNADAFIYGCMDDSRRPFVDITKIDTLHLLLSQGLAEMKVQWAYTADDLAVPGLFTGVRWWPSVDPLGDGNDPVAGTDVDSDFITMTRNQLGAYFQLPGGANVDLDGNGTNDWLAVQNCWTLGVPFKNTFYPKALKFTLVLRDSNGVFADGKTFTHIVYIDN